MRNRLEENILVSTEEGDCLKMSAEIVEDYISSLSELVINSKPLINMLTILAEESIEHAPAIVEAVESHLQKVKPEIKLPVLYLIDSIVKNVNRSYLGLFSKNIVNTFCNVFKKVDENTRASMWKLRQTWNDVFPVKKLFALDVRVHNIDPAWPIAPLPTDNVPTKSIHVNPKFLSPQQSDETEKTQATTPSTPTAAVQSTPNAKTCSVTATTKPVSASEAEMREQLIMKQKELIELQKQKVELELLQAKASLEQQFRHNLEQLDKQAAHFNNDLPVSSESALEKPGAVPIVATIPTLKAIEKQFPAAAASLLKTDANKSGIKIAPASSIAVASAKPIVSRDPRLKANIGENVTPILSSAEDIAKQQQQFVQQIKLQMQSKLSGDEQSSLLNDANKGTSEPEIHNKSHDNKRTKDSNQKKESVSSTTNTAQTTSSQRSSSSSSKSSSSKSSSSRGSSSSSSSKTSSSSTSSSSRKVGSKSRSKSSSSSSSGSPNKIPKLDESCSLSDKRSSSSSKKSSSKSSRKTHSPSPLPPVTATSSSSTYRIPRRVNVQESTPAAAVAVANNNNSSKSTASSRIVKTGLDEEEQSGSLTASSQHPPTSFKDLRFATKNRNYIRRNKEGSRSPEINEDNQNLKMPDASKDEDLRAPIVSVNVVAAGTAAALDTKEDLDLRVLNMPPNNKRPPNADLIDPINVKKSKAEKFDALFGNEDVDLRTLTNPKAGRPPTPPPPVISPEKQNKDGWAKIKMPVIKTECDGSKPSTDRDRNRLNRPKDRRIPRLNPMNRDFDKHNERNIEIIMKQAAEQLNQKAITKSQYNKLIQDVLHMNEDQKLRAAQRKEQEMGMMVWEKGMDGNQNFGNDESIRKDHSVMHGPRVPPGPNGPRWQGPWHQGPWSHPPPFPGGPPHPPFPGAPDGFRPMGPWQNHPRMFGPMRPDFHPPFHAGFNPRMGPPPPPMGPNGPLMMPNGPMNPMGPMNPLPMPPMPPNILLGNGPIRPDMPGKRTSPNPTNVNVPTSGTVTSITNTTTDKPDTEMFNAAMSTGELPPADPKLLEDIAKDTMKSINIDGIPREIRYYGNTGIVFMCWDDPKDIGFQDGARRIFIDTKEIIVCKFNDDYKEFTYEGEVHRIKLGTPTRELYIDDKWYECYFGGRPITVDLGNKKVSVKLDGPPPQVKIGTNKRTDLVVGKINLIINARTMVPVFLDAKPQIFQIEGKTCTLEFIDALQTVLLNGRPFKVEFGGLPKPILIDGKKHFIRFSVLPRGFRAGYVKITGMRGEEPKKDTATSEANQKTDLVATAAPTITNPSLPPNIDMDSTSQDGMDSLSSKPDSQIDVLSSVVPSAMAPSSGLSYQAEPTVEGQPAPAPALTLPLSLNELFQRLVETGIVPSLAESKKQQEEEEKKEPEIIPVSFDKPETLKMKQPAVITALYSGMQCSSCGVRFAPEMATRYSHHLDWHFRQNRKERDSARKAHSKHWYYEVSDWTQFEEIEDLEDRAQSWFETEKQAAENEGATVEDAPLEQQQQPSVPTGAESDACCEVCHEAFEQFYNEEKEEWHLRPTVTYEEKNYHPLCLEDHKEKLLVRALEKSALVLEETMAELEEETKTGEEDDTKDVKMDEDSEGKPVIKEEKIKKEEDGDEDFQVKEENVKEENVKDECMNEEDVKEENIKEEGVKEEGIKDENDEGMDTDDCDPIEIIEPVPKEIELEEIDDSSDDETAQDRENGTSEGRSETIQEALEKIPDDVPLIFENVVVKEEPIDSEAEPEESIAEAAAVDTTQVAVKSTIDGNVELESAAPTIPTAPSKIKINISKSLNVAKDTDDSRDKEKKSAENTKESTPAKPLIPAAIKPSLQGKKLSILPTVEKGRELSGLCSIM